MTAMTSAEPVEVTAIIIITSVSSSPFVPMSLWATTGSTRPVQNYKEIIIKISFIVLKRSLTTVTTNTLFDRMRTVTVIRVVWYARQHDSI